MFDLRESLVNDRRQGTAPEIQLPLERITQLHGFLFDLDPKLYIPNNPIFPPADDPRAFYENIRPILDRHPLAQHGEVRMTGTGLQVIVWLEPPVELRTDGEQKQWSAIVLAVQCSLPVDPDAPGITALTRPIGSTNSKNGATVELLKPGKPVRVEEVEKFVENLKAASFKEIATVLLGSSPISPCPICRGEGTRLDVLDHCGKCYNGCSKATLVELYDAILKPLSTDACANAA